MFGPKFASTLFSIAVASHQTGAFLGAYLGGLVYDRTGSYDAMWWVCIALGLVAAVDHLPISGAPVPGVSPDSNNPGNQVQMAPISRNQGGGGGSGHQRGQLDEDRGGSGDLKIKHSIAA